MNAIKSILVSFLRSTRSTHYAEFINWHDVSQTFTEALKYHTQTISVTTSMDQRLIARLDKKQILMENKINAITRLAETIIENGCYELEEEVENGYFKNTYKVHVLIDRGLR